MYTIRSRHELTMHSSFIVFVCSYIWAQARSLRWFAVRLWRYFFYYNRQGGQCRLVYVSYTCISSLCRHMGMFVYMFMFVLRVARGWCQYHWVDDARPHIRRPEQTYRPRPTRVCMCVYIRTGVTLTATRYVTPAQLFIVNSSADIITGSIGWSSCMPSFANLCV